MTRARQRLSVLGSTFVLETDAEAEVVLELTAALAVPDDGAPARAWRVARDAHGWAFHDGPVLVERAPDWRPLCVRVLRRLDGKAIDGRAEFSVHGAAVGCGERVAVLPGHSGLGKTTLTAACVQRGLEYLTDEVLPFNPTDATVLPYPRPLALDPSAQALLALPEPRLTADGEGLYAASTLGSSADVQRARSVTDVVLFAREDGPVRLTTGRPADAATALLTSSFNHFRDPASAFHCATTVAATARIWHLRYADAREAADALVTVLAAS